MASQRILLVAVGGRLSDLIWTDICRWSAARTTSVQDEWSSDDWPLNIQAEVTAFTERLLQQAFMPPVLYRSEHVDCWSMGDVYAAAFRQLDVAGHHHLLTAANEVFACRVSRGCKAVAPRGCFDETKLLYRRLNEAITAWVEVADDRLLVLVRTVMGGLWTDEEVTDSLSEIPDWIGDP